MTVQEFNTKYSDYIEKDNYGLTIDNQEVIEYLDSIFTNLIKNEVIFQIQQIKLKFDQVRVYVSNDPDLERMLTYDIKRILHKDQFRKVTLEDLKELQNILTLYGNAYIYRDFHLIEDDLKINFPNLYEMIEEIRIKIMGVKSILYLTIYTWKDV